MLVMMTEEQIFSAQQVCQSCLLANHSGLPRWHNGKLSCGHSLAKQNKNQTQVYECEMGFHLTDIK